MTVPVYTVYLAWLQSSTRELQWLKYLKSVFLEIPNATSWSVFQNQVTYIINCIGGHNYTPTCMHFLPICPTHKHQNSPKFN